MYEKKRVSSARSITTKNSRILEGDRLEFYYRMLDLAL